MYSPSIILNMKSIFTLLFIFTLTVSYSQDADGCDGQRYHDFVFVEVDTTRSIFFGSGNTYPDETYQELFYDVYEPADDIQTNRPVILFAFGGSFINGTREEISWLCNAFAQKGYVAVSMDYRLYGGPLFPPPNETQMKNVVMRAVSDMKGAIRHLKQNALNENTFNIDASKMFVGGISAGSILACHTTALDSTDVIPEDLRLIIEENGGLEGNTNDITGVNTEVFGLINYSGGLNDGMWFDEKHPPIYSVHDENDPIVPYGNGYATVFGFPIIEMDGSKILHERAEEFEVPNEIKVFENSLAHVGYFFSENSTISILNSTSLFISDLLCPSFSTDVDDVLFSDINVFPNPSTDLINIQLGNHELKSVKVSNNQGQLILETTSNNIDLSNFESGIFQLSIETTENQTVVKRIVKQ